MADMAASLLLIFLIVPLVSTQRSSDRSVMADRGFGGQGGGRSFQGSIGRGGGGGVGDGFFGRGVFGPTMTGVGSRGGFRPTGPSVPMGIPWGRTGPFDRPVRTRGRTGLFDRPVRTRGRTGLFDRPVRTPYPFSRIPMDIIEPLRRLLSGIMPGGRMRSFNFRDSGFRGRGGFSERMPSDQMGFSRRDAPMGDARPTRRMDTLSDGGSRMGQIDVPRGDGIFMGRRDAPFGDSRHMGRMGAQRGSNSHVGRMDMPRGDGMHMRRHDTLRGGGSRIGRMNAPFGDTSRMRKMRSSPDLWGSPLGLEFFGDNIGDVGQMGKMSGPIGISSDMGMDPFGFDPLSDIMPLDIGMTPGGLDPRIDPSPDVVTGVDGSPVSSMTGPSADSVQNVVITGSSPGDGMGASAGTDSLTSTTTEDVGETGSVNETAHGFVGQGTSAGTEMAVSGDKSVSSGPISGSGTGSSGASVENSVSSDQGVGAGAESSGVSGENSISIGPNTESGAESSGASVDTSVPSGLGTGTVAELSGISLDGSISVGSNSGTVVESSGVSLDSSVITAPNTGTVAESTSVHVDSSVSTDPNVGIGAESSGVSVDPAGGAGTAVDTHDSHMSSLQNETVTDQSSSGNISESGVAIDITGSVEGPGSDPSGARVESLVDIASTDRGMDTRRQDVVPDRGRSSTAISRMGQSPMFDDRRGTDRRRGSMEPSLGPRSRRLLTSLIDIIRRLVTPTRKSTRFPQRTETPMVPRRTFFPRTPSFGSFSPGGMFGSPFGAPFMPRFF